MQPKKVELTDEEIELLILALRYYANASRQTEHGKRKAETLRLTLEAYRNATA